MSCVKQVVRPMVPGSGRLNELLGTLLRRASEVMLQPVLSPSMKKIKQVVGSVPITVGNSCSGRAREAPSLTPIPVRGLPVRPLSLTLTPGPPTTSVAQGSVHSCVALSEHLLSLGPVRGPGYIEA